MSQTMGSQSIQFEQAPYIQGSASIVGTKEGEGPLGKLFDVVGACLLYTSPSPRDA